MHFYVFKDAMSPHILLSYGTSEQLGILQFSVPNLVAQAHIDAITLPTPSGLRKTDYEDENSQLQGPSNYYNPGATLQSLPVSLWQQ